MKEDNIADRIQTIGEILSTKYEQIENYALGIILDLFILCTNRELCFGHF